LQAWQLTFFAFYGLWGWVLGSTDRSDVRADAGSSARVTESDLGLLARQAIPPPALRVPALVVLPVRQTMAEKALIILGVRMMHLQPNPRRIYRVDMPETGWSRK
jgi:hypothetical protein